MKKIINLLRKTVQFLDCWWQELTVFMLIFILAMQVYPITMRMISTNASATVSSTDWGLSFNGENTQPKGNMAEKELEKYNAFYLDDSGEKVIYITFDAGYENGNTEKILNVLKEENVPAAFFLVGHYLKTNPDLVKRMYEEGHIVGNHTMTHPDMSKISDMENFKKEIEGVEALYKELTGADMPRYYRPPQGKFSKGNLEQAKELGYKTIFWSLAYVDWDVKNQPSSESAIKKLCSRIHNGSIVLLHSTSSTNATILQTLIQEWKKQGYTFKSLDDLK